MSYIEINFSKKLSLVIFNESLTSRTTKISAEDQSIVLQNRAQKKRVTNFPQIMTNFSHGQKAEFSILPFTSQFDKLY